MGAEIHSQPQASLPQVQLTSGHEAALQHQLPQRPDQARELSFSDELAR